MILKINALIFFLLISRPLLSTLFQFLEIDKEFSYFLQVSGFILSIFYLKSYFKIVLRKRVFLIIIFLVVLLYIYNMIINQYYYDYNKYYNVNYDLHLVQMISSVITLFFIACISLSLDTIFKVSEFCKNFLIILSAVFIVIFFITFINLDYLHLTGRLSIAEGANSMLLGKYIFIVLFFCIISLSLHPDRFNLRFYIYFIFISTCFYSLLISSKTPLLCIFCIIFFAYLKNIIFLRFKFLLFFTFLIIIFLLLIDFNYIIMIFDKITSHRFSAFVLSNLFFIESFNSDFFGAFFGYGNSLGAVIFKSYYVANVNLINPDYSASFFLEQGDLFDPHNSFNSILLNNGVIGVILFLSIIYVSLSYRVFSRRIQLTNFSYYLTYICFYLFIFFFMSDSDFYPDKPLFYLFFLFFFHRSLLNKYDYLTIYYGNRITN